MKLIKSLTDKCFIVSDIISESKPRRTVRTILKNEEDKIALMSRRSTIYICSLVAA